MPERSLPATPRRRQQARDKGQVAHSTELGPALALVVAGWGLGQVGHLAAAPFMDWAAGIWGNPAGESTVPGVAALLRRGALLGGMAVLPIALAIMVVGVLAGGMQTGFVFSMTALTPRLDGLNPARGLERMFSARAVTDLLKALFKILAVAAAIYGPALRVIQAMPGMAGEVAGPAEMVWQTMTSVLVRVGFATLAIAGADVFYQRWELNRSLRMSREELKEEQRETEGDPAIRALRRRRQRELARRRMMADVPRADVVVTNPTHYAVALRYDPARMRAPMVVAKGRGWLAQRIKAVAAAAEVIITENPPLARELYRVVQIGRPVPPALYQAVAEVLAFVWRVKRRTP
ncbi:MAG TPA: EscU/YscU/HrcU family type III secretion system export apparatus switch protein [Bacillota bacterium]|nr:EscU/YscU/HrcU family type III secretion system export apparatus switch protein [Bacillota bacterium]